MPSSVRARTLDRVRLLELDGPESIPRLERSVLATLHAELDAALSDVDVSGAVITGTFRAFAAGAELAEVAALEPIAALEFSPLGQSLMGKIERSRKPVVAAIRGYCFGGGFDLALACHVRIAATDARFAHPGGSLGIITGWGGTARLPRIVGRARAGNPGHWPRTHRRRSVFDAPRLTPCGTGSACRRVGRARPAAHARVNFTRV